MTDVLILHPRTREVGHFQVRRLLPAAKRQAVGPFLFFDHFGPEELEPFSDGDITLKSGRVEQSNFHDYRVLRMNEAPAIEVYIVKSAEAPGGMGETGTSAISPALTNAIFAATGKRIRKLPVANQAAV